MHKPSHSTGLVCVQTHWIVSDSPTTADVIDIVLPVHLYSTFPSPYFVSYMLPRPSRYGDPYHAAILTKCKTDSEVFIVVRAAFKVRVEDCSSSSLVTDISYESLILCYTILFC